MGIALILKTFSLDLFDLFIPNFCLVCDQKIFRNPFSICKSCLQNIEIANQKEVEKFYFNNLFDKKFITNFYSKYEFIKDGLFQKIIHHLKYNGKPKVGILLGKELGQGLLEQKWFNEVDLIIPVPIHRIKKLKRGYNQSSFIVKGISEVTRKPVDEHSIKRIKNTQTQTHLHLYERIENVKDAFKVVKKDKVKNKNILIVDDVCTTGSTVNEVAQTLLSSEAKQVDLATLAFVKEKDFNI